MTPKDISKRKGEGETPVPDLYTLSRGLGLPDLSDFAPVDSSHSHLAAVLVAPVAAVNSAQQANKFAAVELAILEKRRAEIMTRINNVPPQATRQDAPVVNQQVPVASQQGPTVQDLLAMLTGSQSNAVPTTSAVPMSTSTMLQSQPLPQAPQQPDIVNILAMLTGNAPVPAPAAPVLVTAVAPAPPPMGVQAAGMNSILQQIGLAAILQQGIVGSPNGSNVLAQLLQSVTGTAPAAPPPPPSVPVPNTSNALAQILECLNASQAQTPVPVMASSVAVVAPAVAPASIPQSASTIAELLSSSSAGTNGAGIDFSVLLALSQSGGLARPKD